MNQLILFAAISGSDAINSLLVLLVVGVVLGLLHYLVGIAPFLNATFKTVLQWLIIGLGVFFLINFLLGLIGHPVIRF